MSFSVDVRESSEFASLCSFISLFGEDLNVKFTHSQLAAFLQTNNLESTPQQWLDIHRKLLNRIKVKCSKDKWEGGIKKFVNSTLTSETMLTELYDKDYFSITPQQRARILNIIFDSQFDRNFKFKEKVSLKKNESLRVQSFGSDIYGCLYWVFIDSDIDIIMYKENLEEESFKIIAESVDGMRHLLTELETVDCDSVDLSKLYIESVSPEDINSPNNEIDALKMEETFNSEEKPMCSPVKIDFSQEVILTELNGDISTVKSDINKSKTEMNIKSESDTNAIVETLVSDVNIKETELPDEEISDNTQKDSNLKLKEKKKRGRKPKIDITTPMEIEIPDLNSSLRRSERKRKPVNPFNIIFTPLSTKKNKINDSQNENIKLNRSKHKQSTKSKDKNDKKRGRPKKVKKYSTDKETDLKKKLKKQLKDKIKPFKKSRQKQKQPWEEGDSSEEHIEEIDEEDVYNHEESDISPNLKDEAIWNDKPESDFDPNNLSISSDEEMLIARGRNFFRQKKRLNKLEQEEIIDDKPCQICLEVTLPEMILLCDACDLGHHAMCLKPSLMLIPEGEWYCPKCQHKKLVSNLSDKIVELEKSFAKNMAKMRMQERLNFVNISMTNILQSNRNIKHQRESSNESNSLNNSPSPSYTSSSETDQSDESSSSRSSKCRYKFRESSRKENTRYNFEEIDKMFDNALENDEKYQMMKKRQNRNEEDNQADTEESAPEYDYSGIEPRKKSSGKDMSNILEEEKPQLRRPSKRKRSKFGSDDDEFEDDVKDQDFKLSSEQSNTDIDDEDDKISENDVSDYDDHNWRSRTRQSTRKRHKKKDKKKPRVEFQDIISRPRRSAARKINYLEMLGDEEDNEDANLSSDFGSNYDTSKPPPVLARKKTHRKRKISDSEYEKSAENSNNDSGSTERLQCVKNKNRRKTCLESETDSEQDDNKFIIKESKVSVEGKCTITEMKEVATDEDSKEDKYSIKISNENVSKNDQESILIEESRVGSLSLMNPMRAKDDQDIDVENEVESETECDNESVIKVDDSLSKNHNGVDVP